MDIPWRFNPWILGNERSWVLGFNPNPPHYIKGLMVNEIGLMASVDTLKREITDFISVSQVSIFSKGFPRCFGDL